MKKIFLAAVAAAMFSPVVAVAGDQDFTLVNRTGYTIDEVYVATPASKSWGKDILGDGVLADKAKKTIKFAPTTKSCNWQISVKFDDGSEVEWDAFDLCETTTITLKYNHSTGVTSADAE